MKRDESLYWNKWGLLNATAEHDDSIFNENSFLYTLQYMLLLPNFPVTKIAEIWTKLNRFRSEELISPHGLYNQLPSDTGVAHHHDLYTSPDQLIAYMAHSCCVARATWSDLKRLWFTYNNLTGKVDFGRLMQPTAIALAGAMSGSRFWRFVLNLCLVYSCWSNRYETSGKLKAWTIISSVPNLWCKKICDKLIEKYFGSWQRVFEIHYPDPSHPIRRLLYAKKA